MIYVEPNDGVAPVVRFIEAAQGHLLINDYYLNDTDILRAISADVHRGVKVSVILAGNPYGLSRNVKHEEEALTTAGATVHIAPPVFEGKNGKINYDHAKYAVSSNGALIGTANWDNSAFTINREYICTTENTEIISALTGIFSADFNGDPGPMRSAIPPALVISPGSRDQLISVIEQPGPIYIETEEIGTDRSLLRALEAKGNTVEIIIPPNGAKPSVLSELANAGVKVKTISTIYMHAKMIVGSKIGFIGSENFTTTSMTYNREVGILIDSRSDMKALSDAFNEDWNDAK